MKLRVSIGLTLLLFSSIVFAQTETTFVEKISCSIQNEYNGFKLVINYKNSDTSFSVQQYSYVQLGNEAKLKLVGQLLKFTKDTSLSCKQVRSYNFNGNEGCRGFPDSVKRYSIAIEALYTINRICWPKLTELYSCSPVLYDTKKKRVINDDPKAICCFVKEYETWYEECQKKGTIPKYFPFNKGRYTWFEGRRDINESTGKKGIFE